eukprot:TCONS_00021640-protein
MIFYKTLIFLTCVLRNSNSQERNSTVNKNHQHLFPNLSPYPTNYFTETVNHFVNNRPIIGIVAMKMKGGKTVTEYPALKGQDYFGASFVKWVESVGGRVVPIPEDIGKFSLLKLLNKINGVILPGGDGDFQRVAKIIVQYSRKQKVKKNRLFPVLGICLGAQILMKIQTTQKILKSTDSYNMDLPLIFTKHRRKSQLFGHAPEDLIRVIERKTISFNAHLNSILVSDFFRREELVKHYQILTINRDIKGKQFISTFEDKNAPIFGLQWHPEKSLFVFNPKLSINHSVYGVVVAQYIMNVFMGMARQNSNHFESYREVKNNLVYKYNHLYFGNMTDSSYEQVYVIPPM